MVIARFDGHATGRSLRSLRDRCRGAQRSPWSFGDLGAAEHGGGTRRHPSHIGLDPAQRSRIGLDPAQRSRTAWTRCSAVIVVVLPVPDPTPPRRRDEVDRQQFIRRCRPCPVLSCRSRSDREDQPRDRRKNSRTSGDTVPSVDLRKRPPSSAEARCKRDKKDIIAPPGAFARRSVRGQGRLPHHPAEPGVRRYWLGRLSPVLRRKRPLSRGVRTSGRRTRPAGPPRRAGLRRSWWACCNATRLRAGPKLHRTASGCWRTDCRGSTADTDTTVHARPSPLDSVDGPAAVRVKQDPGRNHPDARHDRLLPGFEFDCALVLPPGPCWGKRHGQCFEVLLIS